MTAFRDWDTHVAPYLRLVEDLSLSVASTASQIQEATRMLPKRPEWPTKAAVALDHAETELALALSFICQAKAQYAATPVIEPVREEVA